MLFLHRQNEFPTTLTHRRERTHDEGHKQNFFRSQYYLINEERYVQVYFHHLHTPQTGSAAVDYLEFVYVDHSILTVNPRRSGFRYTSKHNVLKLFLNYCPS